MAGPRDWMLIDGSSLIFRAYYGVPPTVRGPDGAPVNAVRGFLDTLARLVSTRTPRRLAIASDEDWRPQHRVDLIPSYKAHRVAEPVPPLLIPQFAILHDLLGAVGIDFAGAPQLEAEDVIASWASQIDGTVDIVSGDRDLFALVHDPRVRVLYPEKSGLTEVDESEITRRYAIPGTRYADFAMLRGDPSDGLPGVAGIGAKRAAALVNQLGDVDAIIASGQLGEQAAEYLRRAQKVVIPGSPEPVPLPRGTRERYPVDGATLDDLAVRTGVRSSVDRLLEALPS